MRVWLVDDQGVSGGGHLESLLRQLEARLGDSLHLLRAGPFQPDFPAVMRKLPAELVDLLVVQERAWPEAARAAEVLSLGLGMVVAGAADRVQRFVELSRLHPLGFVPADTTAECLWLALVGVHAARQRERHLREEVDRLQRRLGDRITIERAKGILAEKLGISEEEAYRRLRVESRRQRQQIQVIAEWVVRTQMLFAPGGNGFAGWPADNSEQPSDPPMPPQ